MASKKRAKDFHNEIQDMIVFGLKNPEIAEELGLTVPQVAKYAQRNFRGNPNYLKQITKHTHLREVVLKDRLKFSDKEIMSKYGLTKSELKGCLTYAYKLKNLTHLRKDKRRRDSWSTEEYRFLFKWSGILSREEINSYIKRGKTDIVIKDKLRLLGLSSKNINGLTHSQFQKLFKKEPIYYLKTSAGSPASPFTESARWRIIPWCHIKEMLDSGHIAHSESINIYVSTMALFQKWVHGEDYWKSLTSKPCFRQRQK